MTDSSTEASAKVESNANFIERARAVCDAATGVRMFPIQDGPDIPWSVIEPHDTQCRKNHGDHQGIERLAQRGGLGTLEAIFVLRDQPFSFEWCDAYKSQGTKILADLVAERFYLPQLEAFRTALPEALDRLEKAEAALSPVCEELRIACQERDRLRGEVEQLRKRRSHGGSISRGALGHD